MADGEKPARTRLWAKWKVFAQRAAQVQAHVLFFLLYVLIVVPMGFLRRGADPLGRRASRAPRWRERRDAVTDLATVRRQF
jgi:hypothetical protein